MSSIPGSVGYISHVHFKSLRLLGSLRGSLGTYGLTQKINTNSEIFSGTKPRTFVLGGKKVCFRSPKMYQNSPTAMQNSKNFPGTILRTPVLGEKKFCFYFFKKFTKTLLQQCRFPKKSGGKAPGPPVFGKGK